MQEAEKRKTERTEAPETEASELPEAEPTEAEVPEVPETEPEAEAPAAEEVPAEEAPSEPQEKPKKKSNWKKELLGWVEAIIGAIVIVGLISTFVGRPILVSGHSMENTLMDQERIIITPLYATLEHNDIVVVRRQNDTPLVKRVIAMEGDTLDIDWGSGDVILNGKVLDEPFIRETTRLPVYAHDMIEFPVTVPEGKLFVMGDNRNNSLDSRAAEIGLVDQQNVMGKAIFRIWPLDKAGLMEDYTY